MVERYVTPLVRKLADGYNVDLSTVRSTGAGGRISKGDVIHAAAQLGRFRPHMSAEARAEALLEAKWEREFRWLFSDAPSPDVGADEFDHLFSQPHDPRNPAS
jgi:pyruvate/2-oxoglutarate dehydrogenase complex dihydrolipoamide acyltransferase (E2) component